MKTILAILFALGFLFLGVWSVESAKTFNKTCNGEDSTVKCKLFKAVNISTSQSDTLAKAYLDSDLFENIEKYSPELIVQYLYENNEELKQTIKDTALSTSGCLAVAEYYITRLYSNFHKELGNDPAALWANKVCETGVQPFKVTD